MLRCKLASERGREHDDNKQVDGRKIKLPRAPKNFVRRDHVAIKNARKLGIGTDAKGVLGFQENEVGCVSAWFCSVTERVGNAYLAHTPQWQGVSYLFCGKKQIDLSRSLRQLSSAFELGAMLQGGGTFNGAMLRTGSLTKSAVSPWNESSDSGDGVASMFDIPGEAPAKAAAYRPDFAQTIARRGMGALSE